MKNWIFTWYQSDKLQITCYRQGRKYYCIMEILDCHQYSGMLKVRQILDIMLYEIYSTTYEIFLR